METTNRKPTILKQSWVHYLGAYAIIHLFFIIFDRFPPKFREGTLFTRLAESQWFTERFALYETPEFNLLTVLLFVIFFLSAMMSVIQSKREK
ncbi:YfzA family protein [Paenibacillus septentrionalis]|uniref:YfzA family protein n=1 Tax=Paenibacillus septentrionalis TaxID=429342 RepID=A0ABW1V883_9BACL